MKKTNYTASHYKSDHINLGDPLPLTYTPTRNQSTNKFNKSKINNEPLQQQQRSYMNQPIRKILPILNNISHSSSSQSNVQRRNISPRPIIQKSQQQSHQDNKSVERIQNKLSKLLDHFNQYYETLALLQDTTNIELIELKLNEIDQILVELDLSDQELNIDSEILRLSKEGIDGEDSSKINKLFQDLDFVKTKIQEKNQSSLLNQFTSFIQHKKYWVLNFTLFLIVFFITSIYASDFKYNYCYYFC
ncbi:hypothetical protein KGF54_003266 [Candida jiufengensis]|uniref:uncharacterized protein n=1 Tax=Candida jiufengensis TaxID=497108 RepID=UPI002224F678|nr:uncharacterized protein KGF54_003266 [Candida jiufengensis]KAI5952399.1 hypothetical protein KGF54_003266 [Candida jiufengensis]